jgi:HEAT repeat protein
LNRVPINDGAVRRFRFTASEISKLWADRSDTLLSAADKLGWLNVVEEEAGEDVYAFYHPTFQEYFAACSIDDWDYFLPRGHVDRPVPCQGEDVPTYRVFERQWQQVILFWIGIKNNVQNDARESFIENLINFNEQGEEFYYYRAYCLAGIFIGEFKQFQRSEEITQQIVTWAFGYIDSESMKRNFFLKSIQSLALETLPLVHREYTILSLIDLMKKPDLPDTHYEDLANIIGQIGMGDTNVISSLVSLLKQPNISKRHYFYVVSILEKVEAGNEQLITDLLEIFTNYITSSLKVIKDIDTINELFRNWESDDFLHSLNLNIANTLGKIGVGNKDTIASLEKLLSYPGLLDRQLSHVAFALGAIDKGNDRAILYLIELLEHKRYSNYHHHDIAEFLGIIGMDDERIIKALLRPLEQNTCYPTLYYSIEKSLIKIAVNHGETINSLIELIQQRDLDDSHRYTVANILGKIGISNEKAILALVELLKYDDLHNSHYSSVASILGKISIGNEYAIFNLSQLLTQSDLSDLRRSYVADVLGEIGSSNKQAISALSQVLNSSNLVYWLRHNIAVILGTIDTGNELAISILLELLKQDNLSGAEYHHITDSLAKIGMSNKKVILTLEQLLKHDDLRRSHVIFTLGKIDVDNEQAILALSKLFWNDLDGTYCSTTVDSLVSTISKRSMPQIVRQFKYCVTDEIYQSNSRQYQAGFDLIFYCAQTLSYPTFQLSWNQPSSLIQKIVKRCIPRQIQLWLVTAANNHR